MMIHHLSLLINVVCLCSDHFSTQRSQRHWVTSLQTDSRMKHSFKSKTNCGKIQHQYWSFLWHESSTNSILQIDFGACGGRFEVLIPTGFIGKHQGILKPFMHQIQPRQVYWSAAFLQQANSATLDYIDNDNDNGIHQSKVSFLSKLVHR